MLSKENKTIRVEVIKGGMFLRAQKAFPKKFKKILLLNLADFIPLLMPPFI